MIYHIEPSLSLLYYVAAGPVQARTMLAAEEKARQDPLRRPGMKILIDLTLVSSLSTEREDFQALIDLNTRWMAQGHTPEPTALLGRHDYDVTLGQIFDRFAQPATPVHLGVFLSLHDAVAWLDLGHAYTRIAEIQRTLQLKAQRL
jgi:hypothetical protein